MRKRETTLENAIRKETIELAEAKEVLEQFVSTFGYRQGGDGEWKHCRYCQNSWLENEKHDKKCPVGRARELLT